VLLALTGYETGLLVVAAVFIVFALVAALVVPRSRPEFPGNRLGVFLAICGVFFVAQMTAVLLLAEVGEADESAHEEAAPPGEEPSEPEPTPLPPESEPGETETETETTQTNTGTDTETETAEAAGDPVAGKEVFLGSAGCAGCHTLSDAGSTGSIGPNLDAASPSHDKAVERVTNGQGAMPSFKDTLSEEQIQDVAAYVSSVTEE
jgi:cytochrome c6